MRYSWFGCPKNKMGVSLLAVVLTACVFSTHADEIERVVGGLDAVAGEFPYQAALWQHGVFQCGGSIISPRHILTAAHCLYDLTAPPYDDLEIFTGAIKPDGGNSFKVREVVIHPDYSPRSVDSYIHDIAVIQIYETIESNQYQKPIDLATDDPAEHSIAQLSGYGRTGRVSPFPKILQKANVTIISNEDCQSKVKETIYDTQLCALDRVDHGACSGDSGGPLAHNGELVGVVSWSYPCAVGVPDVYTRVAKYQDFIKKAIIHMDMQ